MSRRSPQGP